MGNKCCSRRKRDQPEAINPALHAIREAQKKYFDSHIESDLDESDGEEKEISLDVGFGSQDSLDLLDTDSVDDVGQGDETQATEVDILKEATGMNNNVVSREDGCVETVEEKVEAEVKVKPEFGEVKLVSGRRRKSDVVKRRTKAKYIRLSKRADFFSIFNSEDKKARSVDPKMYAYPFENLVFEGGGNKGLAYCGAVRLLEDLDIWPQIRRLAGTSAGAMTASLLAIGYNSHDLEEFFSLNLNNIFLDHKCGYLSLIPNLLKSYGWNPGKRINQWFGEKVYEKTGNMDTTFKQVYEMFGRELCVVVTNLNQMTSLYCHPKTTPDMPVRLAVRMSISIPGMFKAVRHTLYGQADVFVDGGVLCNYPIHCFDGWWLSMEPEDNFLEKLQPLEDIPRLLERTERFGTYNEKTLGFQLYSDNEQDLLKYQLENLRHGVQLQDLPNTKLARAKIRKKKLQLKTDREHRRLVTAMNAFLRALRKHNADRNNTIDRGELEAALKDEDLFPQKRKVILFGDVESDVILDYLDKDHNGQISYNELLSFMEETGINMQNRFLGYQRRVITNFPSFLDTLQATLLTNVKRVYVEERDLKRTVGINTGHVGTSDFVLESPDVEFVIERGRRSLEAFLKYYVATNHLKKKPEYKQLSRDYRKDSGASIISDCSNQSLGSMETVDSASLPVVQISGESALSGDPATADQQVTARTGSASSGKSVSISDKIEVIGLGGYDPNEDELREDARLLGDTHGASNMRHTTQSGHLSPTLKTAMTQPRSLLKNSARHDDVNVQVHYHVSDPSTPLLHDGNETLELQSAAVVTRKS
ncbi:unnamed protein product [Lymnaea stagnalis]|uniref:Calmodulin n=1 Tax=Lymnaea stagnalis TaxID=6523 RepID=A0AAV2IM12_LYMST